MRSIGVAIALLALAATAWAAPGAPLDRAVAEFKASVDPFASALAAQWVEAVRRAGGQPDKADMTQVMKRALVQAPLRVDRAFVRAHDDCTDCKADVQRVQAVWLSDEVGERIAVRAKQFCRRFELFADYICDGAVDLFAEIVLEIIGHSVLEPLEVCGLQGVCPYEDAPTWNVTFPRPKPPPRTPPGYVPSSPLKYILHLTDVHFDPLYTEGLEAVCGDPMCCRPPNPVATTRAAGPFGDYRCDSPRRLLEDMLAFASTSPTMPKIDYIFWTGDIAPHDVWESSKESYTALMAETADMIARAFPGVPVYAAIGNHEAVPVDQFAPLTVSEPEFSTVWLYETLGDQWARWITPEAREQMKLGGSFEILAEPGVRVVSVNDEGCSGNNWWLRMRREGGCCKYEYADPDNTLHWLVEVLQRAEDAGERVFLVRHVSNASRCNAAWSRNFYSIMVRYENTIVAVFSGHSHDDYFNVFYRDEAKTQAAAVTYIGPAATPYTDGNPAFRIYAVDWETIDVVTTYTVITNLTDANARGRATWEVEYTSSDAFGMPATTPQAWHDLTVRMERDQALFDRYYYFKLRSNTNGHTCTDTCRTREICELRTAVTDGGC